MRTCCPTCGSKLKVGDVPIETLMGIDLSPPQKTVLRTLIRVYPHEVDAERLISEVYACDPNGGPDHVRQSIRFMVRSVKRKIEPYGWTIPAQKGGRGHIGAYRVAASS